MWAQYVSIALALAVLEGHWVPRCSELGPRQSRCRSRCRLRLEDNTGNTTLTDPATFQYLNHSQNFCPKIGAPDFTDP